MKNAFIAWLLIFAFTSPTSAASYRTLTNSGQPLLQPDGTPLAGYSLKFWLVDADGVITSAFELDSGEMVLTPITVTTDAAGEFSAQLVPNDKLSGDTYYRVDIDEAVGYKRFKAKILAGAGSVSFRDFYTSGQTLTTGEVSDLAAHVQDDTRHLTASEDAALSAANSPSGGNPLATMNDVGGGTFAALADTPSSYTSQAGKYPRVKSTEDGLEYVSGVGSGEANTASNAGSGGVGLFKQKVAEDLQFKNINAGSGRVAVTDDTANGEVDIDIVEASLVHDNLSGAGTNTHAQIDSHIADAAKHREINDAGTAATDLWSASKIITELAAKSDTSHTHADKADKVNGAAAGNFAGLDSSGNLTDSGSKPADFAASTHTHAAADITSGTLPHERGGLEADVSAFAGLIKISGGVTSQTPDNSSNWDTAYTHTTDTSNPHAVTASQVGAAPVEHTHTALYAAISTKTSVDSPYTLTSGDYTILADASSGAITIILPAAASSSGRILNIKKIDSSSNAVTIDGNLAETIDGAATLTINSQWTSYTLQCDGTAWHIL